MYIRLTDIHKAYTFLFRAGNLLQTCVDVQLFDLVDVKCDRPFRDRANLIQIKLSVVKLFQMLGEALPETSSIETSSIRRNLICFRRFTSAS